MKNLPKLTIKDTGSIVDINGKYKNFKVGKYVTLRQSNWEGIKYFDKDLNALMKGVLDDCLVDGETYIPLDYKTRGYDLKEDSTSYYQHQLDIYCYLLDRNGYKTTNYAYLVYYFPKAVKENGQVEFNVEPKKVETDISMLKSYLKTP